MSFCKKCGAEIEWIKMKSGKMMPRNVAVEYLAINQRGIFITLDGEVVAQIRSGETPVCGHLSHFATCPNANEFRNQKRG